MAKHKIRNTFYWITCECKHSLLMKLICQFTLLQKKKKSKNSTKTATWKLVPGPLVFAKN